MSRDIIHVIEEPDEAFIARIDERYQGEVRANGVVQDITVQQDKDGYHVSLAATYWTRNKRRKDQRESLVYQEDLAVFTGHEAAKLIEQIAWVLLHVDGRGPKPIG